MLCGMLQQRREGRPTQAYVAWVGLGAGSHPDNSTGGVRGGLRAVLPTSVVEIRGVGCLQLVAGRGDNHFSRIGCIVQSQVRQRLIGDKADAEIRTFDFLQHVGTFAVGPEG